MSIQRSTIVSARESSSWFLLWSVVNLLPLLIIMPARADQVAGNQVSRLGDYPVGGTASHRPRPAKTVKEWMAQVEAATVQVTTVRLERTATGLDIILETQNGKPLQVDATKFRTEGNSLIADIPNAVIALTDAQAFNADNPTEEISTVRVTQLDAATIRVSVTGKDALPTEEVTLKTGALAYSLNPEADEPDEEIVVTGEVQGSYRVPNATTATKIDVPIRDIPASIQVIPRQVLEDQRITQVREALANVSGVTPGGAGSQSPVEDFIFRGFADSFLGGNTFVDGFKRFDTLNRSLEVANIEQIEILKGPASVLYGRAEPGGILNIVTKQPLATPFYAVEGTIGNFDFYRPTFDLSGPLNTDRTIRYRLNAAYQNSGSFVDFVETEQVFVAPVISFEFGKNTTLTLEGEYLNTSKVEYLGIPASGSVLPNPLGRVPRSRFIDDPDLSLERKFVGVGYRLQHKFSDKLSIRNGFRAGLENYDEDLAFKLGLEADNRTVNRLPFRGEVNQDFYFLQTDIIGKIQTGIVKQDLLLGVELGWINFARATFTSTLPVPPIDLFNPNFNQPPIQFDQKIGNPRESQNQVGVYAQDLISIGDNLKILLGGRFDFVKDSFENELGGTSRQELKDTAFNPRVGIVYQPIQPVSLYASWSRSFQPSGAINRNSDDTLFEPTTGEQFEVGAKTEFLEGKLVATLAAYQITKQNIVVADPNNTLFSIQVGEQRSRGIEFDIAGEILPGWKIIASYAYIDAEITEDTRPAFKRNTPNNVPRNSASLWTTYEFTTGFLKGFGIGAGAFFVGDRQGDLENMFELPSYVRTDAAIYYRREQFRAALNFKNLFNVYYFESSNTIDQVFPGAPFTVLGTISWQF